LSPPPPPGDLPTASPGTRDTVRVDVPSAKIRSDAVVEPGQLYVDQFLTYFDQYARSHRVWSPDSTSLLVPVIDADGTTRITILFANADAPESIDGVSGLWSP